MEFTVLEVLWYFLIFLLIAGYFVLDGFDLGIGVLSPFVAKDEKEMRICRHAIGPVWDGNEVWLLTAGGALFAAFAPAYATTFSGFYLAIMLVLFGLIVRVFGLEYAHHDPAWMKVWNALFFIGSLLPALLTGVAVGNVFAGIPMDAAGNYNGIPLFGLISPFTLLCGLFGLCMMLTAGACWLSLKAPLHSNLRKRAVAIRVPLQIVNLVLFVLMTLHALLITKFDTAPVLAPVRWILFVLFVVLALVSLFTNLKGKALLAQGATDEASAKAAYKLDLLAFITQSATAIMVVFLLATSMFPYLVAASANSVGPALTIANTVAADGTLFWMTAIACVGVPIVLVYHVITYYTFRGRIKEEDLDAGY